MNRSRIMAVLLGLFTAGTVVAEAPRFAWKAGDVFAYRVRHTTTVAEVLQDPETQTETANQTVTKLDLVKRWQVTDVDANGVATLSMSVTSLRMETLPSGREPIIYDSTAPNASDATLREEMDKYLNKELTVVRVDSRGQLVEVKQTEFGSAARLTADLPFKVVLPEAEVTEGQTWTRDYPIVLEPPQGAGESYDTVQTYTAKPTLGALMVVGVTTALKQPPLSVAELIPILPLLPEGDLFFHPATGRYQGARLKVEKQLDNHQGVGSRYRFESSYAEDLVPVP